MWSSFNRSYTSASSRLRETTRRSCSASSTAPQSAQSWLAQGGLATLGSYGATGVGELPREHVDWLRALRLSYDDGRRFFVHAGIDPQKPLDAQGEDDMLWIREPFLSDARDYGRLIVHGHTPVESDMPDLRSNRLNLDTWAVFGGPLTAAVFAAAQTQPIAFLQAGWYSLAIFAVRWLRQSAAGGARPAALGGRSAERSGAASWSFFLPRFA
jgi:diadenosine tetraphosphatase ApaH/serine/threonine PP2A family protein phosphatase